MIFRKSIGFIGGFLGFGAFGCKGAPPGDTVFEPEEARTSDSIALSHCFGFETGEAPEVFPELLRSASSIEPSSCGFSGDGVVFITKNGII